MRCGLNSFSVANIHPFETIASGLKQLHTKCHGSNQVITLEVFFIDLSTLSQTINFQRVYCPEDKFSENSHIPQFSFSLLIPQ